MVTVRAQRTGGECSGTENWWRMVGHKKLVVNSRTQRTGSDGGSGTEKLVVNGRAQRTGGEWSGTENWL